MRACVYIFEEQKVPCFYWESNPDLTSDIFSFIELYRFAGRCKDRQNAHGTAIVHRSLVNLKGRRLLIDVPADGN